MRLALAVLILAFFTGNTLAGTLSEQEAARLKSDIAALFVAFEKGDPTLLLANTHESVLALVGGKEGFEKAARETLQQLQQLGGKFVSSEVGTPTQTYPAGDEEVCFVPRISVMEVQSKQIKITSFMIAIRQAGGPWKFLDGAGLRKNPELLGILLPKLPNDIALPPNTAEVL